MNRDEIQAEAELRGCSRYDLIALSKAHDPFYIGSETEIIDARWFADLWNQFDFKQGVHIRAIHYALVTTKEVFMPPGVDSRPGKKGG